MTRFRILRAGASIPLFAALLFAGCAGTTTDMQSIMSKSTPGVLEPEMRAGDLKDLKLPEQSPGNVALFEERPEFAYFVVDTFITAFAYDKGSVTRKNIEKKEHLKMLRVRAGREGANGLIVVCSKDEKHGGGATNYDMMEVDGRGDWGSGNNRPTYRKGDPSPVYREGNVDVVNSDKLTTVFVTSYAIYRRLE